MTDSAAFPIGAVTTLHPAGARRAASGSPLAAVRRGVRALEAAPALAAVLAALLVIPGAARAQETGTGVEVGPPPVTRKAVVADTLHGEVIEDPYRWLEDQDAPETREWIREQNAHTDAVFEQLPGRENLRTLAERLLEIETVTVPEEEGGRYFFARRRPQDDLFILYVREGLHGEDRVLLDPHPMSEDHTTSVGYRDISRDGKTAVYAVRRGGVDEVELRVMDVDSGEDLPDVLPTARYGSVTLTPDAKGLYYSKFGAEEPRIYYHAMGTDPSQDIAVFGEGYTRQDIPFASLSDDGRWLLVHVIHGSSGPTEIFLRDLEADAPFVTVIDDDQSRSFADFAGDRLVITTNLDAPNKRVVAADLANPSVGSWKELVPEREDVVIEGVSPVGGELFVSYLKDVQPRVARYDLQGGKLGEIEFETLGSVGDMNGDWDSGEGFFTFSSFHVPTTVYRYDVASGEREVWFETRVPIDTESVEVEQVWYSSTDGTRVPMFVVHRRGLALDGDNPTFLTGYGGFNVSLTPGFSATAAAWVELGGVYARPNLRGGGEFGEEWHEAGMLENKQNVFDDFLAAAEWLVERGYTRPERLAISGGSNGGLLVGAAITQRPELFGAAVITYPLLDMLRYHEFMVARFWVPEYGSAEDPEMFPVIRAYSPYHNVEPGTDYPATLLISGDGDTRVAPLHARKMTALLQEANGGEEPILLRYHTKAGHSGGQPVSEQIEEMVDTFSFLLWQVGGETAAAEVGAGR